MVEKIKRIQFLAIIIDNLMISSAVVEKMMRHRKERTHTESVRTINNIRFFVKIIRQRKFFLENYTNLSFQPCDYIRNNALFYQNAQFTEQKNFLITNKNYNTEPKYFVLGF